MAGLHVRHRPPQQVRSRRRGLVPQRKPAEPAIGEQQHARLQPSISSPAKRVLRRRVRRRPPRRTWRACRTPPTPTTRACGNAALLTLVHPRPTEARVVLHGVGHVQTRPVDRHQPPPSQPRPRRRRARQRPSDPLETTPPPARTPTAPEPGRSPTSTATRTGSAARRPRQTRRSTTPTRPHRSPPSATPSRSRSTPSPAPATTDAAAPSDPPRRSPHRPTPAGTPASTPPPTPDPTTDDPTPASLQPARGIPTKLHRCSPN